MLPKTCRSSLFLLCAALVCLSCAAPRPEPVEEPTMSPDKTRIRIFTGPLFLTGDPELPEAAAVAVKADGSILELYNEVPADTAWEVVELPGAVALPGLHDAHLHVSGIGKQREQVQLNDCRSPAEVRERLQAWAEAHPELEIIHGRGWDQNRYPGKTYPDWRDLDGATDRPVVLRRVDGHAAWLNRAMLDRSGITDRTQAPDGGRIIVDETSQPTGILIDTALNLLDKCLPEPKREDRRRWLQQGMQACADAGLTAIHDMGMTPETIEILQEMAADDLLPLRVFVYVQGWGNENMLWFEGPQTTGLLTVCGMKFYADGALGSRGARLITDYTDEPGTRGLEILDRDHLAVKVASVHKRGGQVTVHAIGDQANRTALAAIAGAQGQDKSHRHRIEHAQVIHPDDFGTFVETGVIASMQPTHCTSDMRWAGQRLGADREKGAYAWRTLLDSGVPLAFGSDAPVESWDPLPGIYAAITRQEAGGWPEGGWHPEQRLNWQEAVAAFSAGAAYAVHRENDLGMLRQDFQFDVTLLDADPRSDARLWLECKALGMVVGGRIYTH
jgi:predicted amidohydrolase YtcJ